MTRSKHSYKELHWSRSYWDIPTGWSFPPIGELFTQRRERSSDKSAFPLYSFTIEDGVTEKTERYERSFLLKDGDENEFAVVHPGDFVSNPMNLRFGAIGCSRVPFPVLVSGYYDVLTPNLDRVDPRFLEAFLRSHWAINLYDRIAIGSLIEKRRVHLSILNETHIPLPPLPEQRKIATILSTWDRAIELTEKLIAAKQQRKAALMQQLLTGKVRFKEFIQSLTRHRTPVGEMPVDWAMHKLATVTKKLKRKNSVGESHVLTASGEHGLVDQREFFNRSVAGADLSGYYLLKRGEFAYNRSAMNGYPFGAIKRLDRYEQGVLSTLYICFGLADERLCDSNFMAHYFEARLLDRQLCEVTQVGGRAHGLLNITDADFYSMHLVLPGIEEQRKIAPVLNEQQREIDLLQQKLEALRRQKKGLMQQLLTGKVRVKVTESSGE